MRHLRMVGLCLVAVFAIAAVAATSASALPEWGKCEKLGTKTGAYTDANCTKKAKPLNTGEFKFIKGSELKPVQFVGKNVGSGGVLNTEIYTCGSEGIEGGGSQSRKACVEKGQPGWNPATNLSVECESEVNHGEQSGSKNVVNVSVKFLGCKVFGSTPCSNGPTEGEIQVNALKGNLGYIKKATKEVGILLTPAKSKGEFVKFNCGGIIGTVVGVGNSKEGAFHEPETTGGFDGIISPITPVNQMTSTYEQVYTTNGSELEPGNVPSKFEGKHIELLEDFIFIPSFPQDRSEWSPAAEEITNVNRSCKGHTFFDKCENEEFEEGEIKA